MAGKIRFYNLESFKEELQVAGVKELRKEYVEWTEVTKTDHPHITPIMRIVKLRLTARAKDEKSGFDFILFFEELIFKDLWWNIEQEVERQDKEIKSRAKKWDELIAKTFEGFEIKRGEIIE